jgi:Transglycosylase SLT domain
MLFAQLPTSNASRLSGMLAFPLLLVFMVAMLSCGQSSYQSGGPQSPPPSGNPTYFSTEPSHATFLPRPDSFCASAVTPNSFEPRPDNNQANHTITNPPHNWSVENYWTLWRAKRDKVTGNFTGTTTEIIQWAACKWGIDEDTIRADAVQESYWHQSTIGDVCGPVGEGSYGLMQIKNMDCTGTVIHGGYPHTMQATALNVDWYAAHIRSCYDGDFYDGGDWLYHGQTVDQIAAQNGWNYVFWGCIGFHYSGNWTPGQPYQLAVQQILADRTWLSPNF